MLRVSYHLPLSPFLCDGETEGLREKFDNFRVLTLYDSVDSPLNA